MEQPEQLGRFVKQGTSEEKLWGHGNTGQFWKGEREPGSSPRPLLHRETLNTRILIPVTALMES